MRRLLLISAATLTLAGSTGAFAATDAAAPTAAPDPYQGAWTLTIDGQDVGPVANVDGCSVVAIAADPRAGTMDATVRAGVEPCSFEFGAGMTPAFGTWLEKALAGADTPRSIILTRSDQGGGYGLELTGATLRELHVPKVDRASRAPLLLRATVGAATVRRVARPLPKVVTTTRPFVPAATKVTMQKNPALSTLGPWTAKVGEDGMTLGTLPVRLPEEQAVSSLDPWLDRAVVRGTNEPRDLTLTFVGDAPGSAFELQFDTHIVEGDLAPRADGNRTYGLAVDAPSVIAR